MKWIDAIWIAVIYAVGLLLGSINHPTAWECALDGAIVATVGLGLRYAEHWMKRRRAK